jgi:hypothetical protein
MGQRLAVCLTNVALLSGLGCSNGSSDGGAGDVLVPMTTLNASTGSTASGAGGATPGAFATGTMSGSGGTAAMTMTGAAGSSQVPTKSTGMAPEPGEPMAMDECGLHTGYAGDEYCIAPPPSDKGFQLHIGPTDYANPEPQYLLEPNEEITSDFSAISGNDKQVYFYYRQFRMRPGAHHNIITAADGGGFGMGRRIGTSNLLAEDSPKGGVVAPENQDVGIPLSPLTPINVSLHSINTSDQPQLRELWVNFWYVDAAMVKEPIEQMFETGDMTFAILPGEDTTLGPYSCSLVGDGRMLWFYGHRHANNVQFTATRVRGAQRDVIYDANNWEDPLVLEYSSTVQNPAPDLARGIEGGWSGILDFKTGDTLEWQCHVVNNSGGVLAFTNNTYTGEMCIMDAELAGVNCVP